MLGSFSRLKRRDRRNVLPGLVVARTVTTMQRIEDAKLRPPRGIQDLPHVWNTFVSFGNALQAIPYFAAIGNEIIVGIDDHQRSDRLLVSHFAQVGPFANSLGAPFRLALFVCICQRSANAVSVEISSVDWRARLLPPRLIDPTSINAIKSDFINESQHDGLGAIVIAGDWKGYAARTVSRFA